MSSEPSTPAPKREQEKIQQQDGSESLKDTQTQGDVLPERADSEIGKSAQSPQKTNRFKQAFKKYWWLLPLVLLVWAGGGYFWMRSRSEQPSQPTPTAQTPQRLSVETATAQTDTIRAWVSSLGRVRAFRFKHLAFEEEGDVTYLANRNGRRLREGDRVTEGELLARIDDRELTADLRQAEAALAEARQQRAATAADVAQAQAQLQQARAQVEQAQAQLTRRQTSLALAQSELERYRYLFEQGAITENEFENRLSTVADRQAQVQAARAQVQTARQQVEAAQAQVQAAQEQLQAAQAGIDTAQARVAQAQVALEGTRLRAPFDGVVAYLNITEGDYYTPQIVTSQLGGDYQGILERIPMVIIDPSQFEVLVDLAGPSGERLQAGQPAFVTSQTALETDADEGMAAGDRIIDHAQARGEVFSVNPAISPGGRAVSALIRLQPESTETLRHGERVTTWIAVEAAQNAVVVPLDAVVYRDRVPYVFVVNPEEQVVEQREVELGITGITQQQITAGVQSGEQVVTAGQNDLVGGAPIRIVGNNE